MNPLELWPPPFYKIILQRCSRSEGALSVGCNAGFIVWEEHKTAICQGRNMKDEEFVLFAGN